MTNIQCPNCHHDIAVIVSTAGLGRPVRYRPPGVAAANNEFFEQVLEFARTLEPRWYTSAELYTLYRKWAYDHGHKVETQQVLGYALAQNGFKAHRKPHARGYIIHEVPAEQEPAELTARATRRHEAAVQREAVSASNVKDAMLGAQPAPAPREETVEIAGPAAPRLGKAGWVKLPWE